MQLLQIDLTANQDFKYGMSVPSILMFFFRVIYLLAFILFTFYFYNFLFLFFFLYFLFFAIFWLALLIYRLLKKKKSCNVYLLIFLSFFSHEKWSYTLHLLLSSKQWISFSESIINHHFASWNLWAYIKSQRFILLHNLNNPRSQATLDY
jgi:hypothetical protein